MFIQTEDTPNPATMKFMPGREVLGAGAPVDITDVGEAEKSPLAAALFDVDGVRGVFLGRDFITVTRDAGKDWITMKPEVLAVIMDHFVAGLPILVDAQAADSGSVAEVDEGEIVRQIREIIEQKVRPAVAQDGGDITFHDFDDGVVYLRLKGSCAGCPSSTITLKRGIENMLKHYVPEVREVQQVR